ncbi:pirin family protein [Halosquirtibacter laminarini]|uniref:Pirin family protein n=1 Tax=Halosquirtibacter laminarini TaxID=3374600 RepID=A0AC61NH60_9BACT|nr:pirin family protein [Prolixibacteraceae bacterium]
MKTDRQIKNISRLNIPWKTQDPFLFGTYHHERYPGGDDNLGLSHGLEGRNKGNDFSGKDGWSMYHGSHIPGFPSHPHCGFETVSIVTEGMVDHSDSMGAHGRFGDGDVQWLTAGNGINHSEMFPMLNKNANPLKIFQLWLNLPAKSKSATPYYQMLWSEDIPKLTLKDSHQKNTILNLISGYYGDKISLSPNPDSWAADPNNHVQIWTLDMEAGATFVIPPLEENVNRSLYFYQGDTVTIEEEVIESDHMVELKSEKEIVLHNGDQRGLFVFLQGKPIAEPVVQYGPFVAESNEALKKKLKEYRETEFGGWPWSTSETVHDKNYGRFSVNPDGNRTDK